MPTIPGGRTVDEHEHGRGRGLGHGHHGGPPVLVMAVEIIATYLPSDFRLFVEKVCYFCSVSSFMDFVLVTIVGCGCCKKI